MRHNKKFNHLGRKSAHRQALLSNMAASLILHKRINTTMAKAKALKMYVEPLITKSKDDSTHARRIVFSYLQSKEAVTELFREISVRVGDRPGGYTRILRTGNRLGDNAEMCMMELVDFNEAMLAAKDDSKKGKKKRSRRGAGKKEEAAPVAEAPKTPKAPKSAPAAKETPAPKAEEAPVAKADESPAAGEGETPAPDAPAEESQE